MESLRESWSRLRSWMGREAMDRDMDEEMRFHIEKQTEKNVRAGMSPEEARRAALLSFGGMERFKEESRDEARPRRLEDLVQDVRFGLRTLARNPGFTLVAVLTLALGIGANTAIFSVVDGVLLRPVPVERADRLMVVWETDRDSGTTREPSSVPDYLDFQERSRTFDGLAAFAGAEVNLIPAQGEPVRLAALAVSHEYLPMLGVRPMLGRGFTAADDNLGAPDVALIGEGLWRRLFAGAPSAVGRTIRFDDRPTTVIGVLPDAGDFGSLQILSAADYARGFADRGRDTRVEVWVPLRPDPQRSPRDTHPIIVLGRLAPGATPEAAQQELVATAAELEKQYPSNKARGVFIEPLSQVVFGPVRPALYVLLGAVALVLLVACANIANLLFARGAVRLHEVAVRTALGAGWRRLIHQFLVESTLLTLAGIGLGLLFAIAGLHALLALAPGGIPRLAEVGINGRVLGVTLGGSVLVALIVGLMPAFQARRADLQSTLKEEGRGATTDPGRGRLRAGLVVAELALAVVLLAGAGLLLRSFWLLRGVDPGFQAAGVLKAEFQLPASRYPADFSKWPNWPEQRRFYDAVLERVRALPGVEAAAVAGNHPLDPGFTNSFYVVGRREEARDWPEISVRRVDPAYFETLRVPLVAGRSLRQADGAADPAVLLINEQAARRFFPGRDPLGQQIAFWGTDRTIVGIVRNERSHGLAADSPTAVYAPLSQCPSANGAGTLLVRVKGDPAALTPAVRSAIRAVDPELAVFGTEPLETTLEESIAKQRFTMLLVTLFAGLALVLAVVGVYGILSYIVAQRTPEMGIRMAMGAAPANVVRLIVLQGTRLALWGLALGLAGAFALTRFLRGLLFGVGAADPVTYAAVVALVFAAAVAASWFPARRATRHDPMMILRAS
ncbi:MAG TPA: ABC transporter permease [Thermoanaerobaculia bacterium]|jgi:putative ABC transport system permease protein|nr:ABC transporter permease [Thermoanaerobaculia bacterium]